MIHVISTHPEQRGKQLARCTPIGSQKEAQRRARTDRPPDTPTHLHAGGGEEHVGERVLGVRVGRGLGAGLRQPTAAPGLRVHADRGLPNKFTNNPLTHYMRYGY